MSGKAGAAFLSGVMRATSAGTAMRGRIGIARAGRGDSAYGLAAP